MIQHGAALHRVALNVADGCVQVRKQRRCKPRSRDLPMTLPLCFTEAPGICLLHPRRTWSFVCGQELSPGSADPSQVPLGSVLKEINSDNNNVGKVRSGIILV